MTLWILHLTSASNHLSEAHSPISMSEDTWLHSFHYLESEDYHPVRLTSKRFQSRINRLNEQKIRVIHSAVQQIVSPEDWESILNDTGISSVLQYWQHLVALNWTSTDLCEYISVQDTFQEMDDSLYHYYWYISFFRKLLSTANRFKLSEFDPKQIFDFIMEIQLVIREAVRFESYGDLHQILMGLDQNDGLQFVSHYGFYWELEYWFHSGNDTRFGSFCEILDDVDDTFM